MSTAMQSSPSEQTPSTSGNTGIALSVFWGAAMLAVFALWLGKFEAIVPTALQPGTPPPPPINPPPVYILAILWAMSGVGALVGLWFALSSRTLSLAPDQTAALKLRQRLGLILVVAGVALAILGLYLVATLRLAGFAESVGLCFFSLIPLFCGLTLQKSPSAEDLVSFVLPRAELLSRLLIGVGGVGIIAFVWLAWVKALGTAYLPELGAIVFESLLCITAGLWLITTPAQERTPLAMRSLLLVLGGGTGLILALEAFFRTILWRDDVLFAGIAGWLGSNAWEFWLCAYVGLLGLVLIFTTMLLARSEARTQPTLRQALYGYNAVASGLLLVGFLAALNVLSYAMFPMTFQWSQRGLISLSEASKTLLAALKNRPTVTAYVLLSQRSQDYNDMKNLLDNCQAAAPVGKFVVKYVSPESDVFTYEDLVRRFPEILPTAADTFTRRDAKGRGVLLVQWDGPLPSDDKKKVPHAFISDRKISVTQASQGGGGMKHSFMGEVEIARELSFFMRDQKKHKIYLLQGNGELAVGSNDPRDSTGGGVLVERLQKDNYDVKGLSFGSPPAKKDKFDPLDRNIEYVRESGPDNRKDVPEDAWAVLVLGADKKLSKVTMDALERYMDRGGRMLVTLELWPNEDSTQIKRSGIEDLLKKYGVSADEGFVIHFHSPRLQGYDSPFVVLATPPKDTKNEFAMRYRGIFRNFDEVRVVKPSRVGRYQADVIFQAENGIGEDDRPLLVDRNIQAKTRPIQYFSNTKALVELVKETETPVPVAVAVSEEAFKPDDPARPRLVVFGNTAFASNQSMFAGRDSFALLAGSLEWMGERPVSGVRPKETANFEFKAGAQIARMEFMPLWFIALGILGLGTGVWIVRRR